jgi:hypothetical protein
MKKNDVSEKEKNFDCLAYKDMVQSEIYEETKDMSGEELIDYFRKSVETGPFAEFWKKIPDRNPKARRAA